MEMSSRLKTGGLLTHLTEKRVPETKHHLKAVAQFDTESPAPALDAKPENLNAHLLQ